MPTRDERRQIAAIGRELNRKIERATRTVAAEVSRELIANTPVDTGHTRAQWRIGIGRPVEDVVGNRSPAGVARAESAQERSLGLLGRTLGLVRVYITNPSVTAAVIEEGNSQREPNPFVRRAIARGVANAKRKLRTPGGGG